MPARRRAKWILGLVLAAIGLAAGSGSAQAAPSKTEQRTLARSAEAALKRAGNLYRSKKFAEAAGAVQEAQESLDELSSDDSPELGTMTAPLKKQLARARELLEAEGVKLPPAGAARKNKDSQGVSFTKQIAPFLVAKCAGCHIQRSRGGLNMGSYVALAKGSQNGTVILAGDAKGSRIVEVLESGDMPRGGAKVGDEALGLLSAWIQAGAKFDGPDAAAPLTSFASTKDAPKDQPSLKLAVVAATGKEEVQFARDVAATLLDHCVGCHGGQNPRANFGMETFNRLLRGGDSGLVLAPGKPEESLLAKKLRGTAGARMPLDKPPLPEEAIASIEKWIALGAKFDGDDPASPLEDIIAESIAQRSNHEQLTQSRVELAAKNWRLILPDTKPNHEETPNVLVYGSVGSEILSNVARLADEQVAKLRKLFKVPAEQPFIKGRLTLYVFDKRYDYSEVGTMLEHREIPSIWRGHWHAGVVDTYGCVLLASDASVPPGLLAQQITGAYVGSLGKIPRWFAEGTARALAAKFAPKDARVKLWDDQIAHILLASEKADAFLRQDLPPEDSDILSYSYVKYLMTSGNRHASLISALQQGTDFDSAFAKVYGGSPSQWADTWAARAAKRGR